MRGGRLLSAPSVRTDSPSEVRSRFVPNSWPWSRREASRGRVTALRRCLLARLGQDRERQMRTADEVLTGPVD